MDDRVILHCDCNGFYASVECALNPAYRSVPMAVCGDPESRHGVILAKNELAKAFGVQTAETVWQARRKCPELVLAPAHHKKYREFSEAVNAIYCQYTDLVEPFSIDESWLDVTGSRTLFGSGVQIANELRRRVKKETDLTISVGVSFNKIFAKLGSDYKKPDATTLITRENYRQVLWPLPVGSMIYVGKVAAEKLSRAGIDTIGQLAQADETLIERLLGKAGMAVQLYARGEDEEPVRPAGAEREVKSVGNGITFRRNLEGEEDVRAGLLMLCDTVAARLRRYGLCCQTVQVQIKSPQFKVISRQRQLERGTDLSRELFAASMELVRQNWDLRAPIRMLTVTAAGLGGKDSGEQLSLFADQAVLAQREKQRQLETAMDRVRSKYGEGALSFASLLKTDIVSKSQGEKLRVEGSEGPDSPAGPPEQ
ncbi:DNA polymerase IV [Bittarella massiliensis (ex Durand et al. 2017)]|uniref:DNA polymerase IV n=1 Tax=Bittarella massiliensis (ex Durand et al. 2017) TaxID=1720313 RepID=UPI000946FC64|nr:DNA polymerase IV [Bittarella massiliensis (ex Durand et al. 2017)]